MIRSPGFKAQVYKRQILLLIACTTLPLAIDVLYIAGYSPVPHLNFATVAFTISGLLMLWGFFHFRILDLMPAARAQYVEEMSDAWIVVDALGRIHDINPAAAALFRTTLDTAAGQVASEFFADFYDVYREIQQSEKSTFEISSEDNSVWHEVSMTRVMDRSGRETGKLIVVKDISERKTAELERERQFSELQETLSQVKQLRGLLPICAGCKNIRDDSGYWHQIEHYIKEHSEADFSHGLCPACARKLYPDLFNKDEVI
jgi:PAS domain S-box-containing protein